MIRQMTGLVITTPPYSSIRHKVVKLIHHKWNYTGFGLKNQEKTIKSDLDSPIKLHNKYETSYNQPRISMGDLTSFNKRDKTFISKSVFSIFLLVGLNRSGYNKEGKVQYLTDFNFGGCENEKITSLLNPAASSGDVDIAVGQCHCPCDMGFRPQQRLLHT